MCRKLCLKICDVTNYSGVTFINTFPKLFYFKIATLKLNSSLQMINKYLDCSHCVF